MSDVTTSFLIRGRNVFHYNVKHNQDQTIPPWIVKRDGQTFYVHHLVSDVGFRTKETPDNPTTKGSLLLIGTLRIKIEDGATTAYIRRREDPEESCY